MKGYVYKISKIVQVDSIKSGFEDIFDNNFRFDGERHEAWEFLYVLGGCIGVSVEDSVYELNPGSLIFYAPGQFHSIWAAHGTKIHLIIMSFSLHGEDITDLGGKVFEVGTKEDGLIHSALEAHIQAYHQKDAFANHIVALKIEELILTILSRKSSGVLGMDTSQTNSYKTIIRIMNDHLYDNLSASEIASYCNLSLPNMKKIFRKFTRRGVIQYYRGLRMLKAKELIKQGKSMAEVSDILHFSSQHYLTESFKRQYHMTPSEYKKIILID